MLFQTLIGVALICVTIFLAVACFALASASLSHVEEWLRSGWRRLRLVACLTAVVLWMLAALGLAVIVWSIAFYVTGEMTTFEEAVYFAIVSFTTLGFGDVLISKDWRLLSGFLAANGFLLFSLATAFFIEFLTQIRDAQISNHREK